MLLFANQSIPTRSKTHIQYVLEFFEMIFQWINYAISFVTFSWYGMYLLKIKLEKLVLTQSLSFWIFFIYVPQTSISSSNVFLFEVTRESNLIAIQRLTILSYIRKVMNIFPENIDFLDSNVLKRMKWNFIIFLINWTFKKTWNHSTISMKICF